MASVLVVAPFASGGLCRPGRPGRACAPVSVRVARQPVRVRAEAEGKVTEGEKKSDGTFYNDENPLPPTPPMSKEYQKKLKEEYLSLGGSPNRAMGSNYFVWISVVIGVLAIITKLAGYI